MKDLYYATFHPQFIYGIEFGAYIKDRPLKSYSSSKSLFESHSEEKNQATTFLLISKHLKLCHLGCYLNIAP